MGAVMTDPFAYWRSALAGKPLTIERDVIVNGFWRKPDRRTGAHIPVATWTDQNGTARVKYGNEPARVIEDPETFCENVFAWLLRFPISREVYEHWRRTEEWLDAAPPSAIRGRNMPDDPVEAIRIEIEAEREALERALQVGVKDDVSAGRMKSWAKRFHELYKRAEDLRRKRKAPLEDAAREAKRQHESCVQKVQAVQKEMAPISDMADRAKRLCQKAVDDYERSLLPVMGEAAPAAPSHVSRAEPQSPPAAQPANDPALTPVLVVKITDQDALYAAVRKDQFVVTLLQPIAERDAKRGITHPGVSVEEVTKKAS